MHKKLAIILRYLSYGKISVALSVEELNRFSVRSIVRGKGLGKILLNAFIEDVSKNGFNWVYLEMSDTQRVAAGLYEKFGFKKIGEGTLCHVIGPYIPTCFHGAYVVKYIYQIESSSL